MIVYRNYSADLSCLFHWMFWLVPTTTYLSQISLLLIFPELLRRNVSDRYWCCFLNFSVVIYCRAAFARTKGLRQKYFDDPDNYKHLEIKGNMPALSSSGTVFHYEFRCLPAYQVAAVPLHRKRPRSLPHSHRKMEYMVKHCSDLVRPAPPVSCRLSCCRKLLRLQDLSWLLISLIPLRRAKRRKAEVNLRWTSLHQNSFHVMPIQIRSISLLLRPRY